jgi:DNA repair exonuclease SbcCD ATPase subunit
MEIAAECDFHLHKTAGLTKQLCYVLGRKHQLGIDRDVHDALAAELAEARRVAVFASGDGWNELPKLREERDRLAKENATLKESNRQAINEYKLSHEATRKAYAECDQLRAEVANLRETLNYLPKVPTEPYEKEMAKEILRLRAALDYVKNQIAPRLSKRQLAEIEALERAEQIAHLALIGGQADEIVRLSAERDSAVEHVKHLRSALESAKKYMSTCDFCVSVVGELDHALSVTSGYAE